MLSFGVHQSFGTVVFSVQEFQKCSFGSSGVCTGVQIIQRVCFWCFQVQCSSNLFGAITRAFGRNDQWEAAPAPTLRYFSWYAVLGYGPEIFVICSSNHSILTTPLLSHLCLYSIFIPLVFTFQDLK
jgi:hypothetical protein